MSSDSDNDDKSNDSWIHWFCNIEGHEFLVEIKKSFFKSNFNLYGIKNYIPSLYE